MFITITNTDKENIIINTTQIATIYKNNVAFSSGVIVVLSDASLKKLTEELYGAVSVASPSANEHTVELLNDLHHLVGGRGDAKPTSDRKARLKARLKDFSEDDLKLAAQNLGNDAFMQGDNDNNKRYGNIDWLLRTSTHVNRYLEEQPQKKKGMF